MTSKVYNIDSLKLFRIISRR